MNLRRYSYLVITLLCFFFVVPAAQSASVKDRMAARIPEINSLKDKGLVGENNLGYLEYRTAARPNEELINAENKDRKSVYAAIGKNQGAAPDLVGKRRAKMIADSGVAGRWYEKADGTWYKK